MPVIKKRITAEYLERKQQRSEQNGRGGTDGDEEPLPAAPPPAAMGGSSPLKRKAASGTHLLKGLDGEVLVEKRKRTLPPAEHKLDVWLDENLEKKSESTLSVKKLYQFYTDMCQQDATNVLEMEIFRQNLRNKFGKEFGLKDNSAYNGLLKESKPRKKPVVAPSLGYKLKDLIQEALKASGSPTKGVMFAWVKKFIAAKYPALQIELKPHFLRSALEREIYSGKVELVKGIGFCGFYRLPGPPEVEEDPAKTKKKGGKKTAKEEESAESADDTAEKDGEQSDKSQEKTDDSSSEQKDDKKMKKAGDESVDEAEEGKEDKKEEEDKEQKKAKKKKKKPSKPKRLNGPYHSNPQTINDIFPLAMTYMAEPKEASFARIRKYLEKYYGKSDIDMKLKRCMEHGCETGMWERVSGSGASGSFQLQVDSFNPEHTESLTDMVCSAIIACTEPKISSVRLLKSYICEYHPEFNIDTRPIKLRNALERAEKHNQLRRISGIGMSGSFQLVEQFSPSPTVLAGDDDDDEDDNDHAVGTGKEEVYVVRQTKSGRRAPIEKTQLDFSSTDKKKMPSSGARNKVSNNKRKPASPKKKYAETSIEEEESSEEEEEEVAQDMGYTPRPTKSRGGSAAAATKKSAAKAAPPARAKSKAVKGRKRSRTSIKQETAPSPAKKGKQTPARSPRRPTSKGIQYKEEEEEEEEEEEDTYSSRSPPSSKKNTPAKKTAIRRGRASKPEESEDEKEEEEEEENYYEVEEEKTPTPAKRGGVGKAAAGSSKKQTAPSSPKKGAKKETVPPSPLPEARTPRSASKSARKSLEEMASDEEDEEEEYVARPSTSRGSKKR